MAYRIQKMTEEELRAKLPEIEQWVSNGMTIEEISDMLDISRMTFHRYKNKYPFLADIFKRGTLKAVNKVVETLFKRATGYTIEDVETTEYVNKSGELIVKTKRNQKHVLPDIAAIIFYLKNRRNEDWKDRREHIALPTSQIPEFNEISDEDLTDMIKTLSSELTSRDKSDDNGEIIEAEVVEDTEDTEE